MDAKTTRLLCRASRADGRPCKALALPGKSFCFGHSPDLNEKRQAARSLGGKNKASSIRLRKLTPPKLVPVFDKLEAALSEVHSGELSPAQATAMASLGRALQSILTAGELEARLRQLEEAMKQDGPRTVDRKDVL